MKTKVLIKIIAAFLACVTISNLSENIYHRNTFVFVIISLTLWSIFNDRINEEM